MVTTTSTSTSLVQSATQSLLSSLSTGSGVDTTSLVSDLVTAQFAARTAQLTAKADKLTAQISGVSTIKSAITGFATALDTLAKGGTLQTQPVSSSTAVLGATAISPGTSATLAATVRVDRLATAQVSAGTRAMNGDVAASRGTALGTGTFTLQLGTATYETTDGATTMAGFTAAPAAAGRVSFTLENATVDSIAAAINTKAKALGITASVVTGADGGAYLSIKGATGAANAFTLAVDGDDALAQFAVGEGSAVSTAARNAALTVDGVAVERAANSIEDLVPGVKLTLAGTGTAGLSATRPTAALTQAVEDVVDTYNDVVATLEAQTNSKTGTLFGDAAAQALLRKLKTMTLAKINPAATGGAPATLAELGVRTAKNGTLSVDGAVLSRALSTFPDAVEKMFKPSTTSTTSLASMLQSLATTATAGAAGSTTRYTDAQDVVADARDKVAADTEAMTTRLTAQFTAMNTRVSAYKSVQSFLTNQIAAWNKSDS